MIENVARAICRADPEVRMGDADGVVEQRVNIEWVHYVGAAKAAIAAMQQAQQWQGIESAPKDRNILVWFDHDADPYQDPQEPTKLTPYAAWAEGGEYLAGKGLCIAKWHPKHFEAEDEYGTGYWMPAAWFAHQNGDWEVVCNPTHWMPLPTPPNGGSDAE